MSCKGPDVRGIAGNTESKMKMKHSYVLKCFD